MKDIIIVKPEKCVGCNVCVRNCPAPEANIIKKLDNGSSIVNINTTKCIACGECIRACSHGARDYVDDTEAFMSRLPDETMIVLADPAIKAAFPNQWKGILDWFKKKGCLIYDASFGADICTWALLSVVESKKCGNIISQPCSAVMNYVKMYQAVLQKNLAPIYSPSVCMAIYIKNYLRRSNRIALLSPCIAKKLECLDTGLVEFNVTFRKLMNYFEKNDIVIPSVNYTDYDYDFEDKQGQLGSLTSRPGGLSDNILYHNSEVKISSSSGCSKVYGELELYSKTSEKKLPEVFDILSCEYGCNMGPGTGTTQNYFDVTSYMQGLELDIKGKMSKGKGMFRSGDDKLFKKFDEDLELDDFLRSYRASKPTPVPTLDDLNPIFESMNKHTDAERNHNCGACGYKSCYDLALAIYRELAAPDACICMRSASAGASADLGGVSEKLAKSAEAISESLNGISESNSKIANKTATVNDLLKNIILFCGKNATMDENSVKQMIKILETTIKSLSSFEENANITKDRSEDIRKSVSEITEILGKLKTAH